MKYIAYILSMPSKGSWDGKWTGEKNVYARVRKIPDKYFDSGKTKEKERAVLQFTKQGEFIKRFDNVSKAAQELNLNATSIYCVCKGIRRYKSTGGFVFRYEEKAQ